MVRPRMLQIEYARSVASDVRVAAAPVFFGVAFFGGSTLVIREIAAQGSGAVVMSGPRPLAVDVSHVPFVRLQIGHRRGEITVLQAPSSASSPQLTDVGWALLEMRGIGVTLTDPALGREHVQRMGAHAYIDEVE